LSRGCLYFGGGTNTAVPGAQIARGPETLFHIDSSAGTVLTLGPSALAASDKYRCTAQSLATKRCVSTGFYGVACTTDADCGGAAQTCQPTEQCFFGAPIPVPNPTIPSLSTCIINVFSQTAVSGTLDTASGGPSSINIPLSSRVYLTGNITFPCPV